MRNLEIIIIGGGLAGLTAGIHLSKKGISVTIIEKNEFPKHKVCGEYISNEVLSYFDYLGIQLSHLKPTTITKLQFSTTDGTSINTKLPLGGFGVSRYQLDFYLYKIAIENGCKILKEEVEDVIFDKEKFTIATSDGTILVADFVIGAFGKRSNIDLRLNRNFIKQKSPWLAVKAHYLGEFPNDLVGLHNFKGGYCGVSKVENDIINICYITQYAAFKEYKNVNDFQNLVVKQNPHLNKIFENSKLLFEKPLTISQISFEEKLSVENHILMIGDTAGLIHPLCGNGMAMAIHSAKLVSELLIGFANNELKTRADLEKKYSKLWNFNFKRRLKTGRLLSKTLLKPKLSEALMRISIIFPLVLNTIIRKTHGKPF
ncbi:NAD(P)/FAD-dependent oxidoreductase [Flavobacterium sp.]|uniref:NAD(P)/FAD-dependent oxidoreductase n=1 Tax=Flavobacterium sp. TaxID=239 RepID=UPI003751F306